MREKIQIAVCDITGLDVDAIVNAANTSLLGGGGVDGAIHRAAGPGLLAECRTLGGCPTGQARISAGYNLKARHVIHTVGPVWAGGLRGEDAKLASCYDNSFALAQKHGVRTIAFPAISTGVYRFPLERATKIALERTSHFLNSHPDALDKVVFSCFDGTVKNCYEKLFESVFPA